MKTTKIRRVRGSSLIPGNRKVQLDPSFHLESVFDAISEHPVNVVRVFDDEGYLTTREVGVKRFQFARLSFFYAIRSLPWSVLITYLFLVYLAILFIFGASYLLWGHACGAWKGTTWVTSLYFTIVSLAANGGYVGEPETTMLDPGHVCFAGRTFIVMILSFANIIFVGLVAALVVGKAEYGGKLGRRIVFSDFCSLTAVPGRRDDCWRLTFRMANSYGQQPLTDGRLRVFIVSAEPLRERRQRRREMARQYFCGGPADPWGMTASLPQASPVALTVERLEAQVERGRGPRGRQSARDKIKQEHRRLRRKQEKQHGAILPGGETNDSAARGRRGHGKTKKLSTSTVAVELLDKGGVHSTASPRPGTETTMMKPQHKHKQGHYETHGGEGRHSSRRQSSSLASTTATNTADGDGGGGDDSCSSSDSHMSIKTNSSGDVSRDFEAGVGGMGAAENNNEDSDDFERVYIRVEELRWTCPEERYLGPSQDQLSLWFPVNITHTIDRRSPLYKYMERETSNSAPFSPTGLSVPRPVKEEKEQSDGGGGNNNNNNSTTGSSLRSFQIVATLDATEMESGATITAKRTYTMNEIITHYRFSNKMVRMRPGSNEVLLDYHYFNEMLPVSAVESTTTDSDAPYDR